MDFEVVCFKDGQGLWDAVVGGARFDAVITDFNMPIMNGGRVIEMLRSHNFSKEVPIMLVTGCYNEDEMGYLMEMHPITLLEKPVRLRVFESAVNGLLLKQ